MGKFLLLFLLLPLSLLGQTFPVDPQTGKITYTEEVLVMDAALPELFDRAKAWILSAPQGHPGHFQEDAGHGLLSGTNTRDLASTAGAPMEGYALGYTVNIRVENDWYWYSFSDFHLQEKPSPSLPPHAGTPARKKALEALLPPKTGSSLKQRDKLLAERAAETIGALIAEMKASLL